MEWNQVMKKIWKVINGCHQILHSFNNSKNKVVNLGVVELYLLVMMTTMSIKNTKMKKNKCKNKCKNKKQNKQGLVIAIVIVIALVVVLNKELQVKNMDHQVQKIKMSFQLVEE